MSKGKILIVEDEAITALDLKGHLEGVGYSVVGVAASGEQALRIASDAQPDLVLMDVVIRGPLDGIQTAELLRERVDAPVVFLTAHGDEPTLRRAKHTAPAAYLIKPFRSDELRATVEVALVKHKLEQLLRASEQRLRTTLESIGDGVLTTDRAGNVDYMNPVAESLSGATLADSVGTPVESVLHLIDQTTGDRIDNPLRYALETGAQGRLPTRTMLLSRNGTVYPVEDACTPIRDADGSITGAVLVFRDVTANREMLDRLTYQARHDVLTGLVNRREFELTLEAQLEQARQTGHDHALLYIDLDQFKIVNDTAGHQAGDELLRQLSLVMRHKLRQTDLIARLGGDEFGVLLENCPLQRAEQIAGALVDCVSEFRFSVQDRLFTVGASIGVVAITRESAGVAELLIAADTACYLAKEKGRNRVEVYQADNAEVLRRRGENDWVVRIPAALELDRFSLYAQRILPVGSASAGHAGALEILLRLQNHDGALIPPMAFLPAAERYSVMPRIDRWVIRHAFKMLREHLARGSRNGKGPMYYSINLSGGSLSDDNLLDFIRQQFVTSGMPPSLMCFEITETAAISHLQGALHLVNGLKQLGCSVALDDFGSGMSSFSYLKTFPVDYLKIDGSFVRDLRADRFDCAVVEGINRIGRVLGMRTIAEYVEHGDVLATLEDIGVDYAQGFALHRPEPLLKALGTMGAA